MYLIKHGVVPGFDTSKRGIDFLKGEDASVKDLHESKSFQKQVDAILVSTKDNDISSCLDCIGINKEKIDSTLLFIRPKVYFDE